MGAYFLTFMISLFLINGYLADYSRVIEQDTFDEPYYEYSNDAVPPRSGKDKECYVGDEYSDHLATWMNFKQKLANDRDLMEDWQKRLRDAENMDFTFGPPTFTCDTTSKSSQVPTSVHQLRPSDINVVAAMGDSVTAGFGVGAENLPQVAQQNRGESWSIGGDQSLEAGVITLSNVLMKFNPGLKGYSSCISGSGTPNAWMNAAVGGATNVNMPGQARNVIRYAQTDSRIDFENDWKIVTLLVGGNDLCRACTEDRFNSTNYRANIEEALDIFHEGLPRAMINLVPMFDITPLSNFSEGIACAVFQPFACPCGILDIYKDTARPTQLAYYDELKELVDSGKYDTSDNFTVAIQPFLVDLTPPIDPDTGFYDKTFLSHDCFHPSRKAHQMFAYMLWNTMLIRYPDKPLSMDVYEENPSFFCPTEENPYIYTRLNSGTDIY